MAYTVITNTVVLRTKKNSAINGVSKIFMSYSFLVLQNYTVDGYLKEE